MLIRGMNTGMKAMCLLALAALLASSCAKLEGDFAFKKFHDDAYRKIENTPEFSSDDEIRWVFAFTTKQDQRDIGVVYLKKELVWVEMQSYRSKIDAISKIVYGTIKDFPPGEYQIVLTDVKNNNQEIARKGFIIFAGEEEE
jgi:hypothetical protein